MRASSVASPVDCEVLRKSSRAVTCPCASACGKQSPRYASSCASRRTPCHNPVPHLPPVTRRARRLLAPIFAVLVMVNSNGAAPPVCSPSFCPFSHTCAVSATASNRRRIACPRQSAEMSNRRQYHMEAFPALPVFGSSREGTSVSTTFFGASRSHPSAIASDAGAARVCHAPSITSISRPCRALGLGFFFGGPAHADTESVTNSRHKITVVAGIENPRQHKTSVLRTRIH